jgi:hypothetical protein
MQNNTIELILNGTTQEDVNILTSKVEQATDKMTEILTRNEILKQNKKDFTEEIVNTFTQTFSENFEERYEKLLKSLFNKILKAKVENDGEDEEGNFVAGYLRKRIEELVMLIYVFKYFDYNEIEKLFNEYGIKLDFKPIEQIINHYNNDGLKQNMKVLIEQAIQLKQKNEEINSDIEENIYKEVPAILRYDKEANPVGITKNVFKKFSLLNLLKKVNIKKAKKKYESMAIDEDNKAKAGTLAVSIADTLVSDIPASEEK